MQEITSSACRNFDKDVAAAIQAGVNTVNDCDSGLKHRLAEIIFGVSHLWLNGMDPEQRGAVMDNGWMAILREESPEYFIDPDTGESTENDVTPIEALKQTDLAGAFYRVRVMMRGYAADSVRMTTLRKLMTRLLELLPDE